MTVSEPSGLDSGLFLVDMHCSDTVGFHIVCQPCGVSGFDHVRSSLCALGFRTRRLCGDGCRPR